MFFDRQIVIQIELGSYRCRYTTEKNLLEKTIFDGLSTTSKCFILTIF